MTRSAGSHRHHDPAWSSADVDAHVRRWQRDGDRRARDEVFHEFLPLARRLAWRYRNPHEPFEDLVQVASMGLLGAIDRFDPERGARFASFAIPTVLGELRRYFRNTAWSAHVPRRAQELAQRVEKASSEMAVETGRAPTVEAVSDYLGLSIEDVLVGLDAASARYSDSLDGPTSSIDSDESQTLGDLLGVDDDGYAAVDARLGLSAATKLLPYAERVALALRIDEDLKQWEIAQRLGCSQMQVSRLLRRAAGRLQALTNPERVATSPERVAA